MRAIAAVQQRRDGAWIWQTDTARETTFRTVDGTTVSSEALTVHDVYSLAAETARA